MLDSRWEPREHGTRRTTATLWLMSIPVDLASLRTEIERIGAGALLVTAAAGPPHVASVLVACEGERLVMGAGRRSRANATERPDVTLVWPDADDGHCLIVDGTAREITDETFVVQPVSAVLHRLAGVS